MKKIAISIALALSFAAVGEVLPPENPWEGARVAVFIDLYRDSGLLPRLDAHHRNEFRSFADDGLHPNTAGHLRLAKTIYYALRSISR